MISTGIIAVIGAILTSIYVFLKSIISKISFKESFLSLTEFLKKSTEVNNFLLIALFFFWIITVINFFIKLKQEVTKKRQLTKKKIGSKELEFLGLDPIVFFSYRLASAFPGQRGLKWYNDPKTAVERLEILFQNPITFKPNIENGLPYSPIWWFRESSSMFIDNFEKLSRKKILIGIKELQIKRIAVNIDPVYYKSYIYVETNGEKQTGLYNISINDIKRSIESIGYCSEEYGLFKKRFIRREEYDDGAALINSRVVETVGAKLRTRFLSDYNFIITGSDSPYNSEKFETGTRDLFNEVLKGNIQAERLLEFLDTFKKREK